MKGGLSEREKKICARLREARELLGYTQTRCAEDIGIERGTLVNYESGRSPVRASLGLRFCRTLIVSEEWLATGRFDACRRAAKQNGQASSADLERKVFFRQCMDLFSEPVALRLNQNALFSEAYDATLAPLYGTLVVQHFYSPRVIFHESDSPRVSRNYLVAVIERHMLLLSNATAATGAQAQMQHSYVIHAREAANLIFRKFAGHKLDAQTLARYEWLAKMSSEPHYAVDPRVRQNASTGMASEVAFDT
jgi:transcriptional regulator with XRE-family HTH domain